MEKVLDKPEKKDIFDIKEELKQFKHNV